MAATKDFAAGAKLVSKEQNISGLYVITKGSVRASYGGGELLLKKGDVIGACEVYYDNYFMNYRAAEEVTLAVYPLGGRKMSELLSLNAQLTNMVLCSLLRQIRELLGKVSNQTKECGEFYQYILGSHRAYSRICASMGVPVRELPGLEDMSEWIPEEDIPEWYGEYYHQLQALYTKQPPEGVMLAAGLLLKGSRDAHRLVTTSAAAYEYEKDAAALLMNVDQVDLFEFYSSLAFRIDPKSEQMENVRTAMEMLRAHVEGKSFVDQDMVAKRVEQYENRLAGLDKAAQAKDQADSGNETAAIWAELVGSLEIIFEYAECGEDFCQLLRDAIAQYKKLPDRNASEDAAIKCRANITRLFNQVYARAFFKSMYEVRIPRVLQMFFHFGYMDEDIAGKEYAIYLYRLAEHLPTDPKSGVYSLYEWLKAIYDGKKMPSRNEFDQDYAAYVHELKVSGKIRPNEEEKMLADKEKKVQFEMDNLFVSGNKMTFGRISSFCPVFAEQNMLKEPENALVSAKTLLDVLSEIRRIDYSAFYRETIYTNEKLGIGKEYVMTEVLPDFILMPNAGTRGVMWQEIEGRKRTTPARMMLSIFHLEDLNATLLHMVGEFRWEMCKRIQGGRWNDVTDPSLTSEYFDYVQFYRKNKDLSADAKDKVKLSLQRARNSFKEMFVRDYMVWVQYECTGSPRLNKVARTILFNYCTMSKEEREKLAGNPLYKELLDRYAVKQSQKQHHMSNVLQKLSNMGVKIPAELMLQNEYLQK